MSGRDWVLGLVVVLMAVLAGLVGVLGYDRYRAGLEPPVALAGKIAGSDRAADPLLGTAPATGKRIALVIGNGRYADAPLSQPARNVAAMVSLLKSLGFEPVLTATDLNLTDFGKQVRQFIDAGRDAPLRLFYYAGHGETYQNQTYLLPVNHNIQRAYELPEQAYPLATLIRGFQALDSKGAAGINLVMLDTCRSTRASGDSFGGDEALGLGRVEPVAGTLIAYATSAGEKAWGLAGDAHSLFTKHLLQRLRERDEIRVVLGRVRGDVQRENPNQVTENSDRLIPALYLAGGPVVDPPPSATRGTLVIGNSQPPGVVVYVDGARLGTAPQELELPVGKVTVTAQREGYEPYQESVWIRAGQSSELNVVLKPVAPPAPLPVVTPVTPPAVADLKPLQVFRDRLKDGSDGPALVVIPAGKFLMGSSTHEKGRDSDERQHEVQVEGFAIGQYEVTFAEYDRFCDAMKREKSADAGWGREQRPVINVSWNDAVAYAQWLSQQTSQKYRLPTEAEWEYAARAGTTTAFWTGRCVTTDQANYDGNYGYGDPDCGAKTGVYRQKTLPVGSFKANPWGLYDTMGNVWEWTCSEWDEQYRGAESRCSTNNGTTGPLAVRGGSWDNGPDGVRSAGRARSDPTDRGSDQGFRLARSL